MKSNNLKTITSQLEELTLTGMSNSERGADRMQSGIEKEILELIPKLFRNKETVCLESLTREMEKQIQKRSIIKLEYNADISKVFREMKKLLTDKSDGHIALCLQTVAETFQVKIPTDLGLHMYFEVLNKYPNFIMSDVMRDVVANYKYARLPIPSEFVQKCEPIHKQHSSWYMSKLQIVCIYENHLVNGFPENKYLKEYNNG